MPDCRAGTRRPCRLNASSSPAASHDTIAQTNAAIALTAEAVLPRVAADEEAAA